MSGPPPKPTAQLKLSGSWRGARRKDNAPVGVPDPPVDLSKDAAECWVRLVAVLAPMRVLSPSDQLSLAHFAEYLARWLKATAAIAKYGEVLPVTDSTGAVIGFRRSPWVGLQIEYGLMVRRYTQEFGLTPSARGRLEISGEQQQDTTFSRARALG